tara:strand:- start:3568 stop:4077 length:510 start_codon:yes stop_codon:yes gene_type:complete
MKTQNSPYYILGIDPGLACTGYAILLAEDKRKDPILVEGGVLNNKKKDTLEIKLCNLYTDLSKIILEHKPDVMAVENLYSHYNHPRTSIIMGHARGVILLAASKEKIPVHNYSATEIKKSLLGVGRATKMQIQMVVQQRLNLTDLPEPPDLADAIAAAYCDFDRHFTRN